MGVRGAVLLLQEIQRGGCIDTNLQSLILLLMCLCPEHDVCRIRVGPLSPNTIVSLRLFQQAFGVTFKVKPDPDTKTVIISGIGIGYKNMARAST
jgi:RNA 3'-terminal phosphate cyclase-like protein